MQTYEFVIPGRPVSAQVKRKAVRRRWAEKVKLEAIRNSPGSPPFTNFNARVTIVFLCASARLDADNVIKPIQDALMGVFYSDDIQVSDVESHRRMWSDPADAELLPPLLQWYWVAQQECVYIRVGETRKLEELL